MVVRRRGGGKFPSDNELVPTAVLELILETYVGVEAPTLTSLVCLLLLEESRVHQQHHQPDTLWVSPCRPELCPDCVMYCASCKRNGPSVRRNSPERRQEIWARRRCQVGGSLSPGALRSWVLSWHLGGVACPQGQVGYPG